MRQGGASVQSLRGKRGGVEKHFRTPHERRASIVYQLRHTSASGQNRITSLGVARPVPPRVQTWPTRAVRWSRHTNLLSSSLTRRRPVERAHHVVSWSNRR